MSASPTRRRWLNWVVPAALTFALLWAFAIGPAIDRIRGARDGLVDAQADLAAGQMKLLVGGYMTQRYRIASSIAEDRYGIELVNTGCVPTDYKTSYGSIYNREMEREIGRRFSNVSLESILREAERLAENNPP